ncbi:hypothetical protein B0J15DRAFT_472750 [Fusarium solani]|uniref:Uncharacterized protein n=1 Tax=Fusarium solani TaxID=169388 RepID=A0A9P9JSE9_FUSSL|nr:uncharacterized protein B0J15DRAFT_472750 [Fusarium solani]KAH7231581.1 hypothetical protein B0J15DRAFT_472750 [Fusarium solani]
MIITKKTRKDHTHWICRYKAQTIFELDCRLVGYKPLPQPMAEKSCDFCLHRQYVDAVALNKKVDEIGRLTKVDDDETEWWEYCVRPIKHEPIKHEPIKHEPIEA